MIENIKNATVIKFLSSKNITVKWIKLGLALLFMFLTWLDVSFGYIAFVLCATYIIFEWSADSVVWVIIMSTMAGYVGVLYLEILMWMLIAILLINLIIDIAKKRFDYKNKRFIALVTLFVSLVLVFVLPLATTYSFVAQVRKLALFATIILSILYIKQINIKHLFMLFATSIVALCVLYMIAEACGGGHDIVIMQGYSKGAVERFSAFNYDPNFTGAMLICAIVIWFILYKKKYINKYWYFAGLACMGYFALITISKATYLIIGLFAIYVIIDNIVIAVKTKNYKQLYELLWYVGVLAVVCAIGWKYIDAMYQRIFNPGRGWWSNENNDGAISNLTTGRSDLWVDYLETIFSSWRIALFGSGVKSDFAVPATAAHSMPIEYLYKYGIVGTLLILAIFVVLVLPYIKKVKLYNYLPLILVGGIFCSIGSISVKYLYVFMTMLLPICYNGAKDEVICKSQTSLQTKHKLTNKDAQEQNISNNENGI